MKTKEKTLVNTAYSNGSELDPELVGSILVALLVMSLFSYVLVAFLLSRIFKKANLPMWQAWIPVLNTWRLLELGGQTGYISLLAVLSAIVSPVSSGASFGFFAVLYIFMLLAMANIGKRLGKSKWFVLLAIFLPIVWMIWLGFDDSKWRADKSSRKIIRQKKSVTHKKSN